MDMGNKQKFTWGDTVVVDGDKVGEVCAITETMNGISYTVEYADGTDESVDEKRLKAAPK